MKRRFLSTLIWAALLTVSLTAQESGSVALKEKSPGRLSLDSKPQKTLPEPPLVIPLPAHAAGSTAHGSAPGFHLVPGRETQVAPAGEPRLQADYFLPDRNEKPAITPENSNLNLPTDLEITATDTGEKIILPAGTYRQILQLPIDSPLMQTTNQARPVEVQKETSRYAEPEKKPIWVRYESLEKIKIGGADRRGGIDLPSHGPKELGPRVWYAKSETADVASSVFYFVFGGLGYSTANALGWSAGNTRAIPGDFEYRLIRR